MSKVHLPYDDVKDGDRLKAKEYLANLNAIVDAVNEVADERIIDDTEEPGSAGGSISNLFNWLANRIKAITGGDTWGDNPAITLAGTKDHVDDIISNPHGITAEKVGAPVSVGGVSNPGGEIAMVGGTGIEITTSEKHKSVTITATGEATPGKHAQSHSEEGNDPLKPSDIGAVAAEKDKGLSTNDYTDGDKEKLDDATSTADASKIVARDEDGRARFADPADDADAATKGYVDGGFMSLSGGALENYTEKIVLLAGTTVTIDLDDGNVFLHELGDNAEYEIDNVMKEHAHSFTLIIVQPEEAVSLTFPETVKWASGDIPDMTTGEKTYVLSFLSVDGGDTWLGISGGEF